MYGVCRYDDRPMTFECQYRRRRNTASHTSEHECYSPLFRLAHIISAFRRQEDETNNVIRYERGSQLAVHNNWIRLRLVVL